MVYGDDEDLASVVGVSSNTVRPCLDSLRWWFWRIKTYLQLICLQSCQQWKKTIFVGRENERQTNHLERSCSHKRSAWSSSITWIMLDLMKTLKSSTCLKLYTFGPSAPFQSCLDSIIVTISSSSCTKSFDWQHGQWSPTQSSHDLIYSEKVPTLLFPTSNFQPSQMQPCLILLCSSLPNAVSKPLRGKNAFPLRRFFLQSNIIISVSK